MAGIKLQVLENFAIFLEPHFPVNITAHDNPELAD